jgi:HPt (histidine-containing phosphotransfer) domain-containing protein
MKGGAGNLGAVRITTICARLEELGRAGDLSGAEELLTELEAEVERVRIRLQARREAAAAQT